ncbi:calcium uptake protein, mitochondrial isoform X1 [Cajanus cajan]|uniref:calcium uptake protein, mitochondrial isoform X1 n=1 Tax=Cajanus cajan TaxID=3821 RepID=UPI00098DB0D1|nr:calcium uptake protein, mitochondrial isoform X1 [Cajanus cajan]
MPSFSTLRRLSLFAQRFRTLHSSPSHRNPKWGSAIVAASAAALALFYCVNTPHSSFYSAFSNNHPQSSSLFEKSSLPESDHRGLLFGDAYRSKVFFNYEKRLRLHSPPEKVFEYFASCRTPEGELLMKPVDLMRAVVPVFPPSESNLVREGYLKGERSPGHLCCPPSDFFMLFDVNSDGLISFKEYIFFVTLLGIPESSFSAAFKMFDKDDDGEIDKEEFKKVMQSMRSHTRQGAHHGDGRRTGQNANASVENGGMVEYLFGKDGKGRLKHDKFVQFIRDLHDEIMRLEFAHYDFKSQKTILAKDFAHSIVASADLSHLGRLLERVDELSNDPRFRDVRITFEEFKNFAELRKKLLPFSLALFSFAEVQGLLARDDFQRAASHVCGLTLSENVVEIVFHLFDTNGDGNLSTEEFVKVLQHRERDIAQPAETGVMGFLSCCWKCMGTSPSSRFFS